MKQQDIHVGSDYVTYPASTNDRDETAARVRVLKRPTSGRVRVRVIVPAARTQWGQDEKLATGGTELDVTTRDIAAPWQQWEAQAPQRALIRAESQERLRLRQQAYQEREAARLLLDPARPLPERYEPDLGVERQDVSEAFGSPTADAAARLHAAYLAADPHAHDLAGADVAALFAGLPGTLRRDVLAVIGVVARRAPATGSGAPAEGTVARVLRRGVGALMAACTTRRGIGVLYPDQAFTTVEADFLVALRADADAGGRAFDVPATPAVPEWVDIPGVVAQLGWVRLAVVPTTGEQLHGNGCHSVQGAVAGLEDHLPWWQSALAPEWKECGLCDGPILAHPVEAAHVTLAAAVWDARGRTLIEPWQRAAVARLVAATTVAVAYARTPEAAAAALTDKLVRRPLGQEGWDAYRWLRRLAPLHGEVTLSPQQAQALSAQRLNIAAKRLPRLAGALRLPADADRAQQLERLHAIEDQSQLMALNRLLFTLPGAS